MLAQSLIGCAGTSIGYRRLVSASTYRENRAQTQGDCTTSSINLPVNLGDSISTKKLADRLSGDPCCRSETRRRPDDVPAKRADRPDDLG